MKLVVGLGNPGSKYVGTRHNVGFLVVDAFVVRMTKFQTPNSKQIPNTKFKYRKRFESEVIHFNDLMLAKSRTFMNRSGIAVKKLSTTYKLQPTSLYIVHDDLDIGLGKYKIQLGKGPRQHKGLESIYDHLGSKEFWHVRIGIENRIQDPGSRILKIPGEEYVLQRFNPEEREVVDRVIREVVDNLFERLLPE